MRWQLPISYLARGAEPSKLGRHFLLLWHLVIVLASGYPFVGWRYTGEPILAFFDYPLPYYNTLADNGLNLLAYLPLGYAWAVYFRCRWFAPLLALLFGAGLSASIEFAQQFLPGRIASNLDLYYNGMGSLAGAILAGASSKLMVLNQWRVFRLRWLRSGPLSDYGLILLLLWLLSQLNPAVPLFGLVVQAQGLPQPWVSPIANALAFLRLLEALGVMLSVCSVVLLVSSLLANRKDQIWAISLVVFLSLLVKVIFAGVLLKPSEFLAWFNLNVLLGALAATLLLAVLVRLQRPWLALSALLSLLLARGVEALWPLQAATGGLLELFRWHYGHLRNFSGMTQWLADLWPWLAAIYFMGLLLQAWRDRLPILPYR